MENLSQFWSDLSNWDLVGIIGGVLLFSTVFEKLFNIEFIGRRICRGVWKITRVVCKRLVTQDEIGQQESRCRGRQREHGDDTDRHRDAENHERSGGQIGYEQPGDCAEELVEGVPLSTAADELQLLIVAASVVAEGLDDASGSRFDPAEP